MTTERLLTLLNMYDENNHDSFVLFAIAKEYEYSQDLAKAIESYEKLKLKDPQYVGLYYHLAKAYEESNHHSLALENYEAGIQIAKKLADFHALSELNNAKTNLEITL